MAISRTSLNFSTQGQSLWGPGYAVGFSVDSGDSLIYDSGKQTQDIDIDAGIFGVTGTGYVQFRVGLFAYAHLGSTGGFDADFDIDVNVDHVGGVETGPGTTVNFDFSSWQINSGNITSTGFDGSPRAGLDLIIEIEAGIEDGNVFYPFGDTDFDFSLVDFEIAFPIVGFDASDLKLEFSLFDEAVTITGQLPTGANTQGTSGPGELVISSTGDGNDFLSVEADIDALLVKLLEKIPGAGAVIKGISEFVFGEHKFDLHDYLSFIPANKFVLAATMLDVTAYAGIHLTEDLELDITGTDADEDTPDVMITLVSDNGTADISDDRVYHTKLGEDIDVDAPVQMPGGPTVENTGTLNVHATYSLENTTLDHDVGIGLNASLTITALFAELQGEWVPDFLKFELGPLFEVTFPEGGFNAELFEVYDPDPFLLQANAFNSVTDTYKVFYTNDAPELWDVSTFENAQNTYLEYRKAIVEVFNQSYADFSYLFTPPQTALPAEGTINQPSFTDRSATWIGNVNSGVTLSEAAGSDNFVIIDPNENTTQLALGRLLVNIGTTTQITAGGARLITSGGRTAIDYTSFGSDITTLLNGLASTTGKTIIYEHRPINGTSATTTLITTNAVEIEGNSRGDILVFFPGENGNRPSHFDGDTEGSEYDRFVANFLASDPDTAVNLDLNRANTVTPTQFVTIFGETASTNDDVNLKEIEAISLRTGNADDTITTYIFADYLETNGGRDVVTNTADAASDFIKLGAGDDFVVSSQLVGNATDEIFGGTGFDIAVHTAAVGQRVDLRVNGSYVSSGTGTTVGIGADASLIQAATLMVAASNLFTNTPLATRITWDDTGSGPAGNGDDWLIYKNGQNSNTGSTIYRASVEAVGFFGSAGDDAVIFTGGPITTGAGGTDLLIADLHGYQSYLNVTSGINLVGTGDGAAIRFGDALIDDFDKWSIIGTSFGDYLSGGTLGDVFSGEEGNDLIYGGTDTVADYLMGGAGNDTFSWYDTGADMMDGDNGFYAGGAGFDYLYIGPGNQQEQHGLYHDFHTSLGGLNLSDGADRGSKAFYTAADTTAQLLEAMSLSANSALTRGVSFQGTTNADFMTYINIESVNQQGTETMDDLLIYQGGTSYIGYDNSSSETDTFVADFSAQNVGIYLDSFSLTSTIFQTGPFDPLPGVVDLGNGVKIQGIERIIMKLGSGADTVSGGEGQDYIAGGGGGDRLDGGGGNDIVNGDGGDDRLYWSAGGGTDNYDGGTGEDRLIVMSFGFGNGLVLNALAANGSSLDIQHAALNTPSEDYRTFLNAAASAVSFTYTDGSSVLNYKNMEFVEVFGSNADSDFIMFQNGLIYSGGESANDYDVFAADLRSMTTDFNYDGSKVGTIGNLLNATAFGQAAITGFEHLTVSLGSGNDRYVGSAGADDVDGGAGDDYIESGGGPSFRERLSGGEGDDTLIFNGGFATLDGGNGFDRTSFENITSTLFLELTAGNTTLSFSTANYAGVDDMFDNKLSIMTSFRYAYDNNSVLQTVYVQNFEDIKTTVNRNSGGFLIGGSVNGFMVGSETFDTFISRQGDDVMIGGGGLDRYLFDGYFGRDVIAGEEQDDWTNQGNATGAEIYFTDQNLADATATRQNNNVLISFANGSVLTIIDYFSMGSQYGMDFTFHFADVTAHYLEVTHLVLPTGSDLTDGLIVTGTAGNDKDILFGSTAFRDTYFGGDGDDLMKGSLGSDVFDGGAGEDMVSFLDLVDGVSVDLTFSQGYAGAATGDVFIGIENIAGGQGHNALRGDRWSNTLVGGNNYDILEGRAGDDNLLGLGGDDDIRGDQGDDKIYGDTGSDTLHGNDGNDYVSGGADTDFVHGDDGDDTLDGGTGDDFLYGGIGNDTMTYGGKEDTSLPGHEDGLDTFDGGDNTPGNGDTADYSQFGAAIGVDMRLTTNTVTTRDGQHYVTDAGPTRTISHLLNVEFVTGTRYDDDFIGTGGANGFQGGAGDDTFVGGGNNDIFIGEGGSDTVDYSRDGGVVGLNQIWGDTVAFYVTDTFGASDLLQTIENVIGTAAFGDNLTMNSGDNVVRGLGGADTIHGQGGNDTIIGGADGDAMFGGTGFDILSYEGSTVSVYIDLDFLIASGGDAEGDTFQEFEGVRGSEVADTLYGTETDLPDGTGGNLLDGRAGDDHLYGLMGNDTLIGGAGADMLDGGNGVDKASYRTAQAAVTARLWLSSFNTGDALGDSYFDIEDLQGSDFSDTLGGSDSANTINGGAGHDYVEGRGGDDFLFGDMGDDTLQGGEGADVLDGGHGIDTADYFDATGDVIANLLDDSLNAGAALGDQFRRIENLSGGDYNDTLTGNDGNNVLYGSLGADLMTGGKGNDLYYVDDIGDVVVEIDGATSGTDTIYSAITFSLDNAEGAHIENLGLYGFDAINATGNAKNNTLFGNDANNVLNGRLGNDILDGGYGNDILIDDDAGGIDKLHGGDDDDTIVVYLANTGEVFDGDHGNDTLDLSHEVDGYSTANSAAIDLSGDNIFTAYGATFSDFENVIGTGFVDTIIGNTFANRLQGGAGADALSGGLGSDTFAYAAVTDSQLGSTQRDSIKDWEASDRIDLGTFDANLSIAGIQGFTFIGAGSPSETMAKGELKYYQHSNGRTYIAGNSGVGTTVDFQIELMGHHTLTTDNFIGLGRAVLSGSTGPDTLKGTSGADVLNGLAGVDVITGKGGADALTGGSAGDTFVYSAAADSGYGSTLRDSIKDWEVADRIDLGAFDANVSVAGMQGFTFVGLGSLSDTMAKGELKYYQHANGRTYIVGNSGVGTTADFQIELLGLHSLTTDSFIGLGRAVLNGTVGADIIKGTAGADVLRGLGGADALTGGPGADIFAYSSVADSRLGSTLRDSIKDWEVSDRIDLTGFDTNSSLAGIQGFTFIGLGSPSETMAKGELKYFQHANGRTYVMGNSGVGTTVDFQIELLGLHTLTTDNFVGLSRAVLNGTANADFIKGTSGADTLNGLGGSDQITGKGGADALSGGSAADTFVYAAVTDSGYGSTLRDSIKDWEAGDSIDLAAIDTNSGLPGVQGFTFVGAGSSSQTMNAGELKYFQHANGRTYVIGNSGDGATADFQIELLGTHNLTADNFVGLSRAVLNGSSGVDTLKGTAGADILTGNGGADFLVGDLGGDTLTGGNSGDRFIYTNRLDSLPTPGNFDRVTDWGTGDKISLAQLDWDAATNGVQHLSFQGLVSSDEILPTGTVGFYQDGTNTFVVAEFDGLGSADFRIKIDGLHTLVATDFELV